MAYGYADTTSANSTAWVTWNNEWQTTATVTSTTSASTTNDATWYTWTGVDTGGTASDLAWIQWVMAPATDNYLTYSTPGSQLSEEDIAAEQARIREAADARQREREAAVVKAKALLASLLDEKQREQLERQRFFEFVSQTGRRMRIKHGYSRNVDELKEDGSRLRTLCAHPSSYDLVDEDHMAAQLLALRYDEASFLRVANVS
jgi:hypothetical protein